MENIDQVKQIRETYSEHGESDYEKLRKLDAKAKRPAEGFAYTFGVIAALILGVGMCLAMHVVGPATIAMTAVGVVVGVVGIIMACVNYPIYKAILKKSKAKYSFQILTLSDKILNEDDNK